MAIKRAQGCLLGQLAGDALGSLVEFRTSKEIQLSYPYGVRKLENGGTWNTLAGQPTDDSEMALLLARMLIKKKTYDQKAAKDVYIFWLNSHPFDCGMTIASGLQGSPNYDSQANGAMMRISPLGIFGSAYPLEQIAKWAIQDAAITHPHLICQQANALFVMAIAYAVNTESAPSELYQKIIHWANDMGGEKALLDTINKAAEYPPADYLHQQGWVLIAFQNALWQLLHAPNFEEGVIDTVMRGGDTDTNAAICGSLLGAVYGLDAVPVQWIDAVLSCRPEVGKPEVHQSRPECFWPVDALELAEQLWRIE
ncbi:MAG: ADP-ribosylglycohydrolase family protein [Spirochaetia bacterium]|nr:ADP-ribosylglycohydrolase family protein [Spirochaetia bacterium]MCF7953832.1 ADP-ribosylglycohydrolase family protein [Spirochaetales bacterium]